MTTSRKTRIGLTTAVLTTTLGLGISMLGSAPAFAVGDKSASNTIAKGANLATIQQKGEAAIDARLTFIGQLQTTVSAAKNMTPAHVTALNSLLTNDKFGLTTLRAKIAADTDVKTARADDKSIVDTYRIYVLAGPQVHLTRGADAVTAAATKETDAVANLDTVVAKLKSQGKDTSAIEAQLATAQSQSQAASAAVAGQADTLLGLIPSGYPANGSQRDAVKAAVKTGQTDAKSSEQTLKAARAAIKTLAGK